MADIKKIATRDSYGNAQDGIDIDVLVQELSALCHAGSGGKALTQRAGGHIHTGDGVHVGVSLQIAVNVAQGGQVFHREKAPVCQRSIQSGGSVTLGENKTIPILPLGVCRVNPHFVEIQIGKHIGSRKASAGMTGFRAVGGSDDALTNLYSFQLKLLDIEMICHCHYAPLYQQ